MPTVRSSKAKHVEYAVSRVASYYVMLLGYLDMSSYMNWGDTHLLRLVVAGCKNENQYQISN